MIRYYLKILLPIPLLIWAAYYNGKLFVIGLLLYLIYRQFIDAAKLYRAGVIKRNQMWYPLLSVRYFKDLYFK